MRDIMEAREREMDTILGNISTIGAKLMMLKELQLQTLLTNMSGDLKLQKKKRERRKKTPVMLHRFRKEPINAAFNEYWNANAINKCEVTAEAGTLAATGHAVHSECS